MRTQNASAFWELLGAITAINPPRNPEQQTLYASLAPIGLTLRGFGFDPNNLTAGKTLYFPSFRSLIRVSQMTQGL